MLARTPIDIATGVIEKPHRLYPTCAFELEAIGPSEDAVAEAIAAYRRAGPNCSRLNIRFHAIKQNLEGGFSAYGTCDRP